MAEYSVGQGVADAISASGGEPRSDEIYIIMDEGRKVSRTMATTGVFYYYQEDNQTFWCPFRR